MPPPSLHYYDDGGGVHLGGFVQAFFFLQAPRQWQFFPDVSIIILTRKKNSVIQFFSPSEEPPASWEGLLHSSDVAPNTRGTSRGPGPRDTWSNNFNRQVVAVVSVVEAFSEVT